MAIIAVRQDAWAAFGADYNLSHHSWTVTNQPIGPHFFPVFLSGNLVTLASLSRLTKGNLARIILCAPSRKSWAYPGIENLGFLAYGMFQHY